MKKIITLCLCIACLFSLIACSGGSAGSSGSGSGSDAAAPSPQGEKTVTTIRLSHVLSAESNWEKYAQYFGKQLEKLSGGTMVVETFPGGQLGAESQLLEQLNTTALEAAIITSGSFGSYDPRFNLFSLPYMCEDIYEEQYLMDGKVGDLYNDLCLGVGAVNVSVLECGLRSVLMASPVDTVKDLQGKKIRTMEAPIWLEIWNNGFKAGSVPMAYSELYSAIQQGVVDGAEVYVTNFISDALYEVAPYYSMIEYTYTPTCIMISKGYYDTLTAEQQGWLVKAGELTKTYSREDYETSLVELKDFASKNNAEYHIVEDKSSFIEATKSIWDTFPSTIKGGQEIVDAILQAKADYTASK